MFLELIARLRARIRALKPGYIVLAYAIAMSACAPSLISVKSDGPPRVAPFDFQPLPAAPKMPLVSATDAGCPPQFAACFDEKNLEALLSGETKQNHYIEVDVPDFYNGQLKAYRKAAGK